MAAFAKIGSRAVRHFVAVTAVAVGFAFALERTGWLEPLDDAYYDYWHQFAGKRRDARYTAVISIDDATLDALKDDPLAFWAPYWARAIETARRAGAKAIGLDFIYTVSAEAWLKKLDLPRSDVARNYDAPLRAELARGDVVLISHVVEDAAGEPKLLSPPQDQLILLPRRDGDTGIANLVPDSDKLVRHFYPVFVGDHPAGLAFGLQLALRAAGLDPQAPSWRLGGEAIGREFRPRRIGYIGPPGTVPTVSMIKLLRPDALADPQVRALKGRVAIIAANNAGTSDRHFTPYSRLVPGRAVDQMTGGEIHANIVETLLSGRYPRSVPLWLEWTYLVGVAAIAAFCCLRMHPLRGFAVVAGAALLCALPAYAAFLRDWVLPLASVQVALGAAFLVALGLRLTGEERERSRIRQIFGRYVSEEVVNKLLSEGYRPDLGGEAITVTVLFSDIRNFTTISEKLTPHETVEMLNAYFSRVCEPILAAGGTVDKYIGDAVMAVFGSPVPHPDHAHRALRAAIGMRREAEQFRDWMRRRFDGRGLPEFEIGIGVHTGPAVIGDIGTPKRKEFTAIGDTVNAASRLEGVTKEMRCPLVASAQTVRAAGPGVKTGRSATLRVKGKDEPIEVFEILDLEGDAVCADAARAKGAPA